MASLSIMNSSIYRPFARLDSPRNHLLDVLQKANSNQKDVQDGMYPFVIELSNK